ncbi:MAG TPA: sugar phosphate isomerase/epimerase [Armatimonadota bacterium]|nr:sugar phosphate isomerase/epimerase [Armatimonadota bacterium]
MKDVYVQTASFSRELGADFHGSLEKIAAAGYAGLELFNGIYGGYSPSELKQYLKSLGLTVVGAHVDIAKMDEQLEYLPDTGCEFVVCPGLMIDSAEGAYRSAELLNQMGAKTREHGMRYGYHNHNSDFDVFNGEHVIDILIKNTDPELVTFELDAGWAWRAGIDAAAFIRSYSGRFCLIHIKETTRVLGPEDDFRKLFADVKRGPDGWPILTPEIKAKLDEHRKINCKLGDGLINVPELKKAADAQGTRAYIVEREYGYTGDIFTSLAEDCAYLRGMKD